MFKKLTKGLATLALTGLCLGSAQAGTQQFIGEVVLTGGSFCPRGSMDAAGQILPVSSNQALFSLIGTKFGGDGRTTFALPDLRGRMPIGAGTLMGGSSYPIGDKGGTETRTMTVANMPAHTHALRSSASQTNTDTTANSMLGDLTPLPASYYHNGTSTLDETLADGTISNTGQGISFENRQPILAMRWCVYTEGLYPSRN